MVAIVQREGAVGGNNPCVLSLHDPTVLDKSSARRFAQTGVANRACEQCGVAIVHNYSRSLPNPSRSGPSDVTIRAVNRAINCARSPRGDGLDSSTVSTAAHHGGTHGGTHRSGRSGEAGALSARHASGPASKQAASRHHPIT